MDTFDLRADVVRALAADGRPIGKGMPARFRCFRHEDKTPSAWLGHHAWGCFTCGFEESINTLADHYGIDRPKKGFTVNDYADRKHFNVSTLESWGVHDEVGKFGDTLVAIPYRDESGTTIRTKYRTATKTFWGPGSGALPVYGLEILAKAKPNSPIILVEGESDCHAGWHHGILVVGIPGSSAWRSEYRELVGGRDVYVWQEPDDAGAKFAQFITADLPKAKVIRGGDAKDLCDLRLKSGKDFKRAVEARMEKALPVGVNPPPVEFHAVLGPTLDRLLQEKLKPIDAVPTPLPSWNDCCRDAGGGRGLARGWHVIAGAKTGTGKSLLALNLGARALLAGERVAFLSLEMSEMQLATRLLSIVSGESVRSLEQGASFDAEAWHRSGRTMAEIHERTGGIFFVNGTQLSTLKDVRDSMRFMADVNGCRYCITDYFQLVATGPGKTILETVQEVSGEIRKDARDLKLVSIGLSQFNRETSKPGGLPPTPQGLMGGSPLENDADQVVLLDHTVYEKDEINNTASTQLLLAKNRHGSLKQIPILWSWRNLRVTEQTNQTGPVMRQNVRERYEKEPLGEAWEPEETEPQPEFSTQLRHKRLNFTEDYGNEF